MLKLRILEWLDERLDHRVSKLCDYVWDKQIEYEEDLFREAQREAMDRAIESPQDES